MKNPSNIDLSSLGPHVQGMYDYFDQKIGFNRPPTMFFDSDPSNQSKVLGKTAYYDPQSLEIHIFTDGRHPKDMLRSIAHELIHHQQNEEGRLHVGGYHGEGYYLKNEKMKKLEQEAMLMGNALMREYEDTLKLKEKKEMSLKEWKNNELNKNLLKKFGILKESLEEAKGEKGDADPLGGERAKFDKDHDGVPDGADKDKDDPEIKEEKSEELDESSCGSHRKKNEEMNEVGGRPEMVKARYDQAIKALSDDNPEFRAQAKDELKDMADNLLKSDPYKQKAQQALEQAGGLQEEEKDDDPRGRSQDGPSPRMQRTGKPDPSGKKFADQGKGKPYLRREGLQETLRRFVKAKNITFRGKKIK